MGKHFGKCALCGKECELTFEHIPPRRAFNSTPARPVSGEEIFNVHRIELQNTALDKLGRNFILSDILRFRF